jgi:fructose-1,6-bisphosphatase
MSVLDTGIDTFLRLEANPMALIIEQAGAEQVDHVAAHL